MGIPPTGGQEMANALTHGLGILLSVTALVILVVSAAQRGDTWYVTAYAIFGATMVILYLTSTLYHAFRNPVLKQIFEIFDHVGIYLLIAGSYTSFTLTILRDGPGWFLFILVWGVAAAGIILEVFFLNRWPAVTLTLYLVLGWVIVFAWQSLVVTGNGTMLGFLVAGGLAYTFGTLFFVLGQRWGWFHAGWHLFVLAGTTLHFFAAMAALPEVPGL